MSDPHPPSFSLKNSSQFLFENRFSLPMYHGNGFRSSAAVKRQSVSARGAYMPDQISKINEEIEMVCEKRSRHSVTDEFTIPYLNDYGFDKTLAFKTAEASDGKNSPVDLSTDDIYRIITKRIQGA